MPDQILRIRRTDIANDHLLLRVTSTKPNAYHLVGTDQLALYEVYIKESELKSLQASSFSGDLEQWKSIIRHVLLHESIADDIIEKIEVVAAIKDRNLTVTLRKNIGGITQRFGNIKLRQNDVPEFVESQSGFEWADMAVASADELRSKLETLQTSVSGQQDQVAKLMKQLDELVQAKKDHEAELLQKFAALLNAKKLKIRDQQRLLNSAKIDPEVAKATREARNGSPAKGRVAKGSRGGKRKAVEEQSDADEEMQDDNLLDEAMNDYDEEKRDEETPPHTEDEATDDDDLDSTANAPPVAHALRGKDTANDGAVASERQPPLPTRDLPGKQEPSSPIRQPVAARPPLDDDDDDTDDEL